MTRPCRCSPPQPVSDLLTPQLEGEELVSMGVTYWQVGEKDRALDLTLNGATLTQQAVDRGVLPKASLAVPYGNLATMYKQLGQASDAAKYADLAKAAGAEKPKSDAPTDDAKTSPRASTRPNGQGTRGRMANGGNSNGNKSTKANTDSGSAAQRARPTSNHPFNTAELSPDYYKQSNYGNSGQPSQNQDGQSGNSQMR